MYRKVIPCVYWEDKKILNSIGNWFLIGLLLRLVFMPIACHGDLISTYHRSYLLLLGESRIGLFSVNEMTQAFFLLLYRPLLPLDDLLVWSGSPSVSISFWLNVFLENPYCYRALFLFKLPYLIFDIACGIVLLNLFEAKAEGALAFKFWMVNPIGIFAVYIFGKFETIPIFFILLSLYCAKVSKPFSSLFSVAIAAIERVYCLAFLPIYLAVLGRNFRERVGLLLIAASIFIFKDFFFTRFTGEEPFLESYFINFLLAMRFDMAYGVSQSVYVFVLAYVFLTLYWIYASPKDFNDLWKFSVTILLVYYATSLFHPQYFAWFTPFVAIAVTKYARWIKLHLVQILCFVVYTFYWGEALAGWLFASIDPPFFINLPSPVGVIDAFFPANTLINVFRTAISGISLYMVFMAVRQRVGDAE